MKNFNAAINQYGSLNAVKLEIVKRANDKIKNTIWAGKVNAAHVTIGEEVRVACPECGFKPKISLSVGGSPDVSHFWTHVESHIK